MGGKWQPILQKLRRVSEREGPKTANNISAREPTATAAAAKRPRRGANRISDIANYLAREYQISLEIDFPQIGSVIAAKNVCSRTRSIIMY